MRDRTQEFFDCVQTFSGVVLTRPHKLQQDPSQFGEAAKKVSERIINTTARVRSLAKLVRQSTFGRAQNEIQRIRISVGEDLDNLDSELKILEEFKETQSTNPHAAKHGEAVVGNLRGQVMAATANFRDVLKATADNLQKKNQTNKIYFSEKKKKKKKNAKKYLLPRRGADNKILEEIEPLITNETAPSQQQDQLLMTRESDDYYMNREEAVKNIEKTVAELGQMYERFGSILAEQEQQTVRIRNDVDDYAANMDEAQTMLQKMFTDLSSNKWLVIQLMTILLFFLVFFTIFVM